MERLPRELVSNVLSRLPARCLLKCKCVCKSWFNLITDPHFILNHCVYYNNLMHSQTQEEHLLVLFRAYNNTSKTYISTVSWDINDPTNHVSSTLLNPPEEYYFDREYYRRVMGPCNGVYFQEGNPHIMINPSLRQYIVLPQSNFLAPDCGAYFFTRYAGFGFDPRTNDYKVVVIKDLRLNKTSDGNKIWSFTSGLYSLNSNSWRKLDAAFPLQIQQWGSSQVYTYVNNSCHWFGLRIMDVVVAFDMVDESFRKIKVPPYLHRSSSGEYFECTMVPFNESTTIGVIAYSLRGTDQSCYNMWVMKDYWDEDSWTKQYSIGCQQGRIDSKLVGFYGSNKFLWMDLDDKRLVLYDPDSEVKTRDLHVYGRQNSIRVARYMESIVSLRRGKEISQQIFFM